MLSKLKSHISKHLKSDNHDRNEQLQSKAISLQWCRVELWNFNKVTWSAYFHESFVSLPLPHNRLWLELNGHGDVFLHNKDSKAVFFSSATLQENAFSSGIWPVSRVPPGQSSLAFSTEIFSLLLKSEIETRPGQLPLGHSAVIHISPQKGWGNGYKRVQFIQCPVRYEIWLALPRLCVRQIS